MNQILVLVLIIILSGCSMMNESQLPKPVMANNIAQVLKVETAGQPNNYTFAVTVSSPDTGCDRYADWWEVITPSGELLYRRVLLHSHVNEQPFRRTGGKVKIQPQQEVIVRVHMHPDGYSSMAQQGTVKDGFKAISLPRGTAWSQRS